MRNCHTNNPANIYPGQYEPMPWEEHELTHLGQKRGTKIIKHPFTMQEKQGHYRIELHAPGFGREDFAVHTNGFSLSVGAVRKNALKKDTTPQKRHHHFIEECTKTVIPLPGKIDTDFVTAEYREGILSIFIAKTDQPAGHRASKIIVY